MQFCLTINLYTGLDEFQFIKLLDEDISGQTAGVYRASASQPKVFEAMLVQGVNSLAMLPRSPRKVLHRQVNKKEMVFVKHYQLWSPIMILGLQNLNMSANEKYSRELVADSSTARRNWSSSPQESVRSAKMRQCEGGERVQEEADRQEGWNRRRHTVQKSLSSPATC